VNDVNAIKNQDWASLALLSISKGKHDGKSKTRNIGGSVFFLQLYLMHMQDEGLDLFKIDEEKIKEFSLKWEPLINYILRNTVHKILMDKSIPVTMDSVLVIDEALKFFLSEVVQDRVAATAMEDAGAAMGSNQDEDVGAAMEDTNLDDDASAAIGGIAIGSKENASRPKRKGKRGQTQGDNVVPGVVTRTQRQKQGIP
ncbi:hypothetical protein Tco_0182313, partial [Tanacetum coccineum]